MAREIKLLESYFDRLWPICRSITGNGLRQSLAILQEIIPLEISEVPSGTKVFDWEVPEEWNIRDAYIITPDGRKTADVKKNNLHLMNYSVPVDKKVSYDELKEHIYTLPSMPDAIPYITSYYKRNWGFCLSENEFAEFPKNGNYRVVIDSSLAPGSLTYGDLVLPGEREEEILFSTYLCHPSMANNELSGPLVTAFLYQKIKEIPHRKYTYRFVFLPETIGAICYLHKHGERLRKKLAAGYVVTCVGDQGNYTYKRSKRGNTLADRAAEHILKYADVPYKVMDFEIGGSDERQYCSPGFNLPVGSLTRSMYKQYKEYHTSLDNKEFVSFNAMLETINMYYNFIRAIELNNCYKNTVQYCEPNLGKRDMYPHVAGWIKRDEYLYDLLHFLSYTDGTIDLIDIAEKRKKSMLEFEPVVTVCKEKKLVTQH